MRRTPSVKACRNAFSPASPPVSAPHLMLSERAQLSTLHWRDCVDWGNLRRDSQNEGELLLHWDSPAFPELMGAEEA